jgi:TRAP-type mannitol/chloroaromatic compound transport system permease small subunit
MNRIDNILYGLVNHRQNNYIEIWMAGYMFLTGCLSLLYCVWVLLGMSSLFYDINSE